MSVVFTIQFLLAATVRNVLIAPFPIVGLSEGMKERSSKPLATNLALVLLSLPVITHLVDIVFWPWSSASSNVLN